MERARTAIHAEWEPDALSRARWELNRARLTLEAASEGEEGKRLDLIAEAVRSVEEAEEAAGAAQRTKRRRKPGKGATGHGKR